MGGWETPPFTTAGASIVRILNLRILGRDPMISMFPPRFQPKVTTVNHFHEWKPEARRRNSIQWTVIFIRELVDTGGNGNPSGLKVSNGDRSGFWSCDCWACYGQGRIEWKTQNWNFFTGFRLVRNAVSSKSLQAKILLNWYAKYRLKRAIFYSSSCFKLSAIWK